MRLFLMAIVLVAACNKKEATQAAPPAPPPQPTEPSEDFALSCAKLFPKELAAATHGADDVKVVGDGGGIAQCEPQKGGTSVGVVTVSCVAGFDKEAAATFKSERGLLAAARELTPMVGRDGFRLGDTSFTVLDDDTPCRVQVSWVTAPAEAAWTQALKDIMARVTPAAIRK